MNDPFEKLAEPALKKQIVLKVFGLGGAGCNAAGFASQVGFAGVEFLAVNTDAQSLDACATPAKPSNLKIECPQKLPPLSRRQD